jgi:lipopolysaccharide transport system ATP-binding protein
VETVAARIRRFRTVGGTPPNDQSVWALREISFEVKEGEALGVIGRNGSGKSTLLKVLSRITEPTAGCAEIRGRVGSLLEVGTGFHRDLTGRENIYLNGAILGMRRREIVRKFDQIVAFAEVERFVDTQVKHYSSGMQVRLAFSVAAHLDPEVLLLDEVLAVGDFAFREKCFARLREVRASGRTVLLVSHDMASVESLCSHAMWLHEGEVRAWGKPSDVIPKYIPPSEGEPALQTPPLLST